MDGSVAAASISGILALITGTAGMYFVNKYLDERKEYLSTQRDRLRHFYSPLEILLKINEMEFDRYMKGTATEKDKEFIEKEIWYPNNREIRRIIMENGHLLTELPKEILDLLAHINVWLSEYHSVYVKEAKAPPVFAGPKGYRYPKEADHYIYARADELRRALNM